MKFYRIYQIFPKRFEPLKNSKWSCSQFYNMNSVRNWEWTQWEKLIRRINSSTIPSFNNFWTSGWSLFCIFKSKQSLNNGKNNTVHRIGHVPVLQYRPSRFQTAPASFDRAPPMSAPHVAAASTCPACNRPYRLRSPRTRAHLPSSSHRRRIPHSCRQIHRRSCALRDAAPQADHHVACRAINLSFGRSPTAPLRPSCREHLHTHRCLRSSSNLASTP
jgi:hypothetical protein